MKLHVLDAKRAATHLVRARVGEEEEEEEVEEEEKGEEEERLG